MKFFNILVKKINYGNKLARNIFIKPIIPLKGMLLRLSLFLWFYNLCMYVYKNFKIFFSNNSLHTFHKLSQREYLKFN